MASARNLEVDLAAGNRAGLLADETGVTAIDSAGDVLDLAGSAELDKAAWREVTGQRRVLSHELLVSTLASW